MQGKCQPLAGGARAVYDLENYVHPWTNFEHLKAKKVRNTVVLATIRSKS